MKGKWIIASILILALFAICGLSIFAFWQGVRMAEVSGIHFDLGTGQTVEVEATEEKVIAVSGPVDLKVENDFGFITVQAGEAGKITVTADKTGWGGSQEQAQNALENLKVIVEQNGNKVHIALDFPVDMNAINIGPVNGASADFTVTVPVNTSVDLYSSGGDLMLTGTQGAATLNTGFGEVTVKDVTGGLTVTTSNGQVTAESIAAGEAAVSLNSDFGDISARTVAGGAVTIKSVNGAVTANKVQASGKLDVRSDFGDLEIVTSRAETLEAHTSNGVVLMQAVNVERSVTVSSDFGDLSLEDVVADGLDLTTQNGQVTVTGATGKISAHSDYGDVDVAAEEAVVNLTSNNGAVTFAGSLLSGEHTLQSDFGDITLSLPAQAGFKFDLQTDFGKIKSDFPVTISGELEEKHWSGTINGGGAQLNVKTQNGNITLQISQ